MTPRLPPRVPTDPGHTGRGPNGRRLCRECGTECENARRTYCSDECVDAWKLKRWPSHQARLVLQRDQGVCALCGLDCVALYGELMALREAIPGSRDLRTALAAFNERAAGAGLSERRAGGFRFGVPRRLWEMDHIVPVAEGGGSCGLDNLRTLCWKCHREETAALRRRLRVRGKARSGGAS